jgi:hypothetical protein
VRVVSTIQVAVDLGGGRLTPDTKWAMDALSQGLRLLWSTWGHRPSAEHASGARVVLTPVVDAELGRLRSQEHRWQSVLAGTKSTNSLQGALSRRCVPSITRVAWSLSCFEAALAAMFGPRFAELGVKAPSVVVLARLPMGTGGGDCGFSEGAVTLFTDFWLVSLLIGPSSSQEVQVGGTAQGGASAGVNAPSAAPGSIARIMGSCGFERLYHVMQLPSGLVHARQPASQYVDTPGTGAAGRATPGQGTNRGCVPAATPVLGHGGSGAHGAPLTRHEPHVVHMAPALTLAGVQVATVIQGTTCFASTGLMCPYTAHALMWSFQLAVVCVGSPL